MSDADAKTGKISWFDLTVEDAESTRQFYEAVVGWTSSPVKMGDYNDHCMNSADGDTVAGICHARGENSGLPSQWLIYINVANLDDSISRCEQLGGKLLQGPRDSGGGRFAVIQDPAGASVALFQPPGAVLDDHLLLAQL